ncbi:MAG TPA: hypothetical protein VF101_11175 [Gaiellaceae bacterium]
MTSFTSEDVVSRPICLHGIELGEVADLIVDPVTMRALGLVVRCGDERDRFLPLAAARITDHQVAIGSALLLLDEVPFYRAQGSTVDDLRGAVVRTGRAQAGTLRDVLVSADGAVERVLVDTPDGESEVRVDAAVSIAKRRAPAA